jgi:hypothetical protein
MSWRFGDTKWKSLPMLTDPVYSTVAFVVSNGRESMLE